MNIEKLRQAYEKENEFISHSSLNEYAPNLHKMLVKEKDFEKAYNSTKYKQESQAIENDFSKITLSDLNNYERILKDSDK